MEIAILSKLLGILITHSKTLNSFIHSMGINEISETPLKQKLRRYTVWYNRKTIKFIH